MLHNMEFHSDCGENSNDQKTSKSSQEKQRKKLGSILNVEKCDRTYDDLHPQVLNDAEKSKGSHKKQQVERKLQKSEELVMYMSCLPSYLERGENPQEKPFNIGVLDWRQLQKWQYNNNDVVGISGEQSPSTSNTTSFISSKNSSPHRSSDNTWSHLQKKMYHPSTPTKGCSSGTKLLPGNRGEFLDCRNGSVNHLKVQQSLLQATQSSSLETVNKLIDSKSEYRDVEKVTGTRSRPFETDGITSGLKGNGMIYKGEASKAKEQVLDSAVTYRDFSGKCKTAVPVITNDPGSKHFELGHRQPDSFKDDKYRSLEENRYTFYGGSSVTVCHTMAKSDYAHFHSFASECGKTKDSQVEKSLSKEIKSFNCPSEKEQAVPSTDSVSLNPSRRTNLEKNSGPEPGQLADNEIFQMKMGMSESTKVRNPSPTRRFSFGVSRIGKSSNSNSSSIANRVSENIPDSKVTSTSGCSNCSTGDKSNATSRARSSPLRRLLDPILKPKGVDSCDFVRLSERNPLTRDRTLKSSNGQIESPAFCSDKGTLNLNGFRVKDIGGPHGTQKNGTSSMQALLQVAVKNGRPLFRFTVDKCSDILAATVKEISSKKTMHRWIYTFLSFSKMKKKSAHWINQGSKDRNHGYISNIVAQMEVSDILYADSTGKGYLSNSSAREFVLSSVGTRDVDQTSDSLPGDELAAIVVKFPERIGGQLNQDGQRRGTVDKQSVTGLQEPFRQVRSCSNPVDDEVNESVSDDLYRTTVILPGGHHGVPRGGEPSPLIERWKSGGSCDCGGWDLGCQLRILANSNQSNQRFKSTKSKLAAFKLFSQEEVEDERLMFFLSPFEDGVFSIEFNSSLKLIQAFAIGIAVLNSRTSAVLSPNMFRCKTAEEIRASGNTLSKIFNQPPVELSAKYFSNPPVSPVGRV